MNMITAATMIPIIASVDKPVVVPKMKFHLRLYTSQRSTREMHGLDLTTNGDLVNYFRAFFGLIHENITHSTLG